MNPPLNPAQSPSLNLGDIYYTLFRHKWKIVVCSVLGFAAAAAVYKLKPPPFQSEAKLFVRYVVSEGKSIGPAASDSMAAKSPDQRGETIMTSEMEILASIDLVRQVAEAVGPEKILAKMKGEKTLNRATVMVANNLVVTVPPRSSVIHVAYKHPDPEIVQPVLREVIERYLKMHVATHRSVGVLGDLLIQETDQLRSRLSQTEEELRNARNKAGVISIDDAKKTYSDQIAGLRHQIFGAQAELAERSSVLEEMTRRAESPSTATSSNDAPTSNPPGTVAPPDPIPSEKIDEYRSILTRLAQLQRIEQELLIQFTAENGRVKELRTQIAAAEEVRNKLQEEYPIFVRPVAPRAAGAASPTSAPPATPQLTLFAVAVEVQALKAKIKTLIAQQGELRAEVAKIDQLEGSILELQRKKALEESNYRYYAASLEQSRINETLGNGRVSNINQIQTPSPPSADWGKTYKLVMGIAAGGIGLGLGWAFATELFLDRSIRRPVDVERLLSLPLFIAIPSLRMKGPRLKSGRKRQLSLAGKTASDVKSDDNSENPGTVAMPLEEPTPLAPFCETLRDRLIGYFESKNLTHKPKLVAVSGLEGNVGVTTIAAGLSRSLSETGEGNVLLVDMTVGQGSAQQFIKGKAVCGLDELLDGRDSAHVQEKLYVVSGSDHSSQLSRNLPQRFSKLVPKLKASDFDYIIFDMPPVSQISITPRLAGFMDMVLLVIESEKTNRDHLQRATSLLTESRAHIGAVLNKTRNYVPAWLHQEF